MYIIFDFVSCNKISSVYIEMFKKAKNGEHGNFAIVDKKTAFLDVSK